MILEKLDFNVEVTTLYELVEEMAQMFGIDQNSKTYALAMFHLDLIILEPEIRSYQPILLAKWILHSANAKWENSILDKEGYWGVGEEEIFNWENLEEGTQWVKTKLRFYYDILTNDFDSDQR